MERATETIRDLPGSAMEVELKLELDRDQIDALAASPVLADTPATDREQVSTYFDTPEQDLRTAGVSLRVRQVDGRHVQTVKAGGAAAAGMFARPEWENDVAGPVPELEVSSPLRTLVTEEVLARIQPLFTVAATRRTWLVKRDGATIELVADSGAVTATNRSTPLAEIELELKNGPPTALFALARDLGRSVPLRLGVITKAERGYRLIEADGARATKAERLELEPGTTAAEAFAAIVGNCLRQFRLNEEQLRRLPTPDAIHQARVALRRLRSALSIFRPIVADDRFAQLAGELRWLAASLGEARDLDVLLERLDTHAPPRLETARDEAYAAALAALDSQRARDLMIDLIAWTALGDWRLRPGDPDLPGQQADMFAAHVLGKLRRRIKRRGRDLKALDDEERHEVRIQAKKLRYATGFFEALFAGEKARQRYKAFLKVLEKLQDELGGLNDLATAPVVLARYGLEADAAEPEGRRAALIAGAAKAHAGLVDAKRFW